MPMYPYNCPHCQQEFERVMTIPEYDQSEFVDCSHCGQPVSKKSRIVCAASVTRASYVDGTKRSGFAERREALKLKSESYNMKPEDRKDIKKVIKQIERSTHK